MAAKCLNDRASATLAGSENLIEIEEDEVKPPCQQRPPSPRLNNDHQMHTNYPPPQQRRRTTPAIQNQPPPSPCVLLGSSPSRPHNTRNIRDVRPHLGQHATPGLSTMPPPVHPRPPPAQQSADLVVLHSPGRHCKSKKRPPGDHRPPGPSCHHAPSPPEPWPAATGHRPPKPMLARDASFRCPTQAAVVAAHVPPVSPLGDRATRGWGVFRQGNLPEIRIESLAERNGEHNLY